MARKKSSTLTEAELKLMEVLWLRGECTVGDVVAAFPSKSRPAYSTVLTILRILEQKQYVTHRKEGRAFVYAAKVGRKEARRSALNLLVSRFFDNSPELLMLNILERQKMHPQELQRLKKKIEEEESNADD